MNTVTNPEKRYLELDALRGVAALLVVFFHLTLNRPGDNALLKLGTTGVDLFFTISGFVIFMSLQSVKGGRQFMVNRVARLYPVYWAAVTFSFILMTMVYAVYGPHAITWNHLWRYLANLTMFQYYLGFDDIDTPYWTLLVEMLFYVFMLGLYKFKLLKFINAIGLVIITLTVIGALFFYDISVVRSIIVHIPLLQFMPLFLMGINFYKIYTTTHKSYTLYIVPLLCLVTQILLFDYSGRSKHYINVNEYAGMLTLYFIFFIAFVNDGLKFIVNKYTLFFGRISYALYVIHMYISVKFLLPIFVNKFNFNFWLTVLLILFPTIIILATIITYRIEIPMRYKLKKALSPVKIPKTENEPQ